MQITFHGHACVALGHGGTTVVIDPGSFSDAAGALRGADGSPGNAGEDQLETALPKRTTRGASSAA